ncbi:hypothetical protein FH972_022168 [Carpinus fangiana]|uniref:Uncharacterized protein n=1 Tax=Carpinus fangiana TaxID=176857 RepID=A0A5N6KS31_9ROSI|nr:hypothetical protein FH972_022168 [Carpinus fangiana]
MSREGAGVQLGAPFCPPERTACALAQPSLTGRRLAAHHASSRGRGARGKATRRMASAVSAACRRPREARRRQRSNFSSIWGGIPSRRRANGKRRAADLWLLAPTSVA